MDTESDSGDDPLTTIDSDLNSDVVAKLRRLKIQESILDASLKKSNYDQINLTSDSNRFCNWKEYSAKLNKSVTEIKNTLEDITVATSDSNDNLINVDIEDIKRDVLNLDAKIKTVEDFINSELLLLKRDEEELVKQMNEKPKLEVKAKGKLQIQRKQYTEVVPSPVRVLINSPLKSEEVQNFLAFKAKSKNRYGGWNEYNHNIFVHIWNKFYISKDVTSSKNIMNEITKNNLCSQFLEEVLERIPDTKPDDILLHSKWYSEYCYLKNCQTAALDKWKANKGKIKRRQNVKPNTTSSSESSNNEKLCRKQNESIKSNIQKLRYTSLPEGSEFIQSSICNYNITLDDSVHVNEELLIPNLEGGSRSSKSKSITFARPTKQWLSRCHNTQGTPRPNINNIDNVDKLCIPDWRKGLK